MQKMGPLDDSSTENIASVRRAMLVEMTGQTATNRGG
jgi:hypothetical protein